jgi:hypothetical protein
MSLRKTSFVWGEPDYGTLLRRTLRLDELTALGSTSAVRLVRTLPTF